MKESCKYEFEVKLLWTGMNAQSPLLDRIWPRQTVLNAIKFNAVMENYIHTLDEKFEIIDFVNLTRGAEVSDGFHYLTDVNLYKAQYLLNMMDFGRKRMETEKCQQRVQT